MPIYEYQCQNCGHHFEKLESISAEPTKHCPKCNKDQARRLISASGFQLKGDGWYVSEYKKKPKSDSSKSSESSDKKSD